MPLDEAIDVPDLQLDLRLILPVALLALQEVIEEAQLQLAAVVGIEVRPVLDAVRLEPFVLRCGCGRSLRNCRADAGPARPSSPR